MLKAQLIIKIVDRTLAGNPKGIPPTLNCNILCECVGSCSAMDKKGKKNINCQKKY
jgi:hypothetical protein